MTQAATYTIELKTNCTTYTADIAGRVIATSPEGHIASEDVIHITRFDLEEYRAFWKDRHPECLDADTIDGLDIGFWHMKDGCEVYEHAESDFRYGWIAETIMEMAHNVDLESAVRCLTVEHAAKASGVEVETVEFDPDQDGFEVVHEEERVTHFSVYLRVLDEKTGFHLARHVVDVPRVEGSGPAVECARQIAALLQVPFADRRTVLQDA